MAEEHAPETEQVEAPAQEAVETNTPFEGEFDPERARRTIDNLRASEKELKSKLSSEEYFREMAEKFGYELADDEPEPEYEPDYDEDEDPVVQRLSALEQAEQDRRQNAILTDLDNHIDKLGSEADLKLSDKAKEWIALSSIHAGDGVPTPEATEQAFSAMREFLEDHGKAAVDKYLKSKRAPTPPSAGSQGQPSGDFDPKSDRSRKDRMAAIFASRQE